MSITQRIFELLANQNKKQSELAEYVGISRAAISDWKSKGTTPTAEFLVKICEFLNISLDYLLTGKESTPKEITVEQQELLSLWDKLDDVGKTMVKAKAIEELRRLEK